MGIEATEQQLSNREVFQVQVAMPPPERTAEEIVAHERAVRTLGIGNGSLQFSEMDAYRVMGKYLDVKLTVNMLMVRGFSSMDHIEKAEKVCSQICQNEVVGKSYTPEQRMAAARILAIVVQARKEMGEHLLELAHKANDKPGKERRLNAPPVALQVNVNPAPQTPSVTVKTGGAADDASDAEVSD
jgi:hypothetical protein